MALKAARAGTYVKQPEGYRAFLPAALPVKPPIAIDAELIKLLSDADHALGRLDGVASVLPNPNLFVAMYVRREAVLSSQIEGTESTLEDVLEFETGAQNVANPKDVEEVVNYVRAMNYGLRRLAELPLSLQLIREIHQVLLTDVRGGERRPGEFRSVQNWIGPRGCELSQAIFIPPPPDKLAETVRNFELFLIDRSALPVLVHCAVAHAQFEAIHPFLDGNGRVGRLLMTLMLCERGVLEQPLLYLSYYLQAHQAEYYDRLMAVRRAGNWEGWISFFIRGVLEVSRGAADTAREILELREHHRQLVGTEVSGSMIGLTLLDYLFQQPIVSVRMAADHLQCSFVTASALIAQFERTGMVREITGQQRNRRYRYEPYLKLFERDMLREPGA